MIRGIERRPTKTITFQNPYFNQGQIGEYCSKLSEYAGWRNDHALNIFCQSCPKISKLHRNGRSKGMCSSIANYLICRNRWNTRPWSTALFGSSSNAPRWDSGQFFCSLEPPSLNHRAIVLDDRWCDDWISIITEVHFWEDATCGKATWREKRRTNKTFEVIQT